MSKIIRKARDQLHSVRDESLRRQLNAARSDSTKHWSSRKHISNTSQHTSMAPGFKFSDIDADSGDSDWLMADTTNSEKSRSSSSNETRRTEAIQTSDYYSSLSSPEGSFTQDNSYLNEADSGKLLESEEHFLAEQKLNTPSETRESQSSSLFDDGPDLDEDYFGTVKESQPDLFDPLGLNLYPKKTSKNTLFDPSPSPEPGPGKEKEDASALSSKEKTDLQVIDVETERKSGGLGEGLFDDSSTGDYDATKQRVSNPSEFLESSTNSFSKQSELHSDGSGKLYPSLNDIQEGFNTADITREGLVTTSEPHPLTPPPPITLENQPTPTHTKDELGREGTSNTISDDEDELFQSATNKLLITSTEQSHSNINDESNPDPLSNSQDPSSMDKTSSENASDPSKSLFSDVESHPLLPIAEDDYYEDHFSDQSQTNSSDPVLLHPDPAPQPPLLTPHPSSLPTLSPNTSPLPPRKTNSKLSPGSQMKISRSGKVVPVVPPRPAISTKRIMSAPDPDTLSIASTVSSVSAYSADEIFNRDNASLKSENSLQSFGSGLTMRSDIGDTKLLERIAETTSVEEHPSQLPSPPDQQSDSNSSIAILSLVWLLLYLYYSLNPFVYLAGFLAGFFVFYVTIGSAFFWYVQHSEREKERRKMADKTVELPALEELPKTIDTDFESNRVLQSKKFGMVYQYHPTTHHPSQRMPAKVRLYDDFMLEIRYKSTVQMSEGVISKMETLTKDLRECSILIVPEEIAQNRKRRWSKKFPVSVSWSEDEADKKGRVFLFPYTSREKEEWFRRMRLGQEGKRYDEIVNELKIFVRYMGKYMPHAVSPPLESRSRPESHSHSRSSKRSEERLAHRQRRGNKHSLKVASGSVRFSNTTDPVDEEEDTTVSISNASPKSPLTVQRNSLEVPTTRDSKRQSLPDSSISPSLTYGFINAGMARLAWDLWHEERWKKWVQSRIQRKLIRIKTPSFMEPLKVTAVDMGMDMPVIKRPYRLPKLDSRGIWVYLEVDYKGTFNMTIETKLKLEPKMFSGIMHFNSGGQSPSLSSPQSISPSPSPTPSMDDQMMPIKAHHHHRSRTSRLRVNATDEEEELSSGSSDDEEGGTSQLTRSLEEKIPAELERQGVPVYSKDDFSVSLSSSNSSTTLPTSSSNQVDGPGQKMEPRGRKEKILNNMVSRLQKMAAKSKLVAKAAEKVSSYPMILSVEVKSLSGFLVVNMAPPPSDALWYGFTQNPVLDLVAKPKVGQREVTLSYVTDWIEKKLCEVVEKKLVYPNMEDIVIPLLSSGLPEDKLTDLITSPS